MDTQEQGRNCLLDLHPLELDLLRQPGQRVLDAVMREHERRVDIGADLEDHRDAELAITRGLAADVVHVLNAIDGLLERGRDGTGDRVRRGPRIGGRDLNGWRNDVGILGDRQECRRGKSEHHDEDIDHRGEPRVINEEVRESHGSAQSRFWLDATWIGSTCGDTSEPGRTVGMPSTMTRSDGARPERMTRRPSRRSPIWTSFDVTTLLALTVRTMWFDWSGRTEASGTSMAIAGANTSTRTRAKPPGVRRPSVFGTVARAWMVPLERLRVLSMKSSVPSWVKLFSSASEICTLSASGPPCF